MYHLSYVAICSSIPLNYTHLKTLHSFCCRLCFLLCYKKPCVGIISIHKWNNDHCCCQQWQDVNNSCQEKKPDRCSTYLYSNTALWTTTVEHVPVTNNHMKSFFLWYFSAPRCFLLSWQCAQMMPVLNNNTTVYEAKWQWEVCVYAIRLLRTYVQYWTRETVLRHFVCVSDPDYMYDTVTHWWVTDCSICVRRNQVAPSTTHSNILFSMFPPHWLWAREWLE